MKHFFIIASEDLRERSRVEQKEFFSLFERRLSFLLSTLLFWFPASEV